jgi:hypothetical protein
LMIETSLIFAMGIPPHNHVPRERRLPPRFRPLRVRAISWRGCSSRLTSTRPLDFMPLTLRLTAALSESDHVACPLGGNPRLRRQQRHDAPIGDANAELRPISRPRRARQFACQEVEMGRDMIVRAHAQTCGCRPPNRGRRAVLSTEETWVAAAWSAPTDAGSIDNSPKPRLPYPKSTVRSRVREIFMVDKSTRSPGGR